MKFLCIITLMGKSNSMGNREHSIEFYVPIKDPFDLKVERTISWYYCCLIYPWRRVMYIFLGHLVRCTSEWFGHLKSQ